MTQRKRGWFGAMTALAILVSPAAARAADEASVPVEAVVAGRFTVAGPAGAGELPIHLSADWSHPLPAVSRAVIVVHGVRRHATTALREVERAYAATAGPAEATLLIAPQFLTAGDIIAHGLPAGILRWDHEGWKDGSPALGPVPLSSFEALDAVLVRLADPTLFPALRQVVLAGHSAGGQAVQRYAVAGRGETSLTTRRISIRYVVANPSSYVWFGDARPQKVDAVGCPNFNRWKYGLTAPPPYVGPTETLERGYIARDVVYLLGELDTDPNHPALDRSCAAEAQGAFRYARGMQYLFGLELRHPNLVRHRVVSIPDVGHDGGRMFGSLCGRAALFDQPGCRGL